VEERAVGIAVEADFLASAWPSSMIGSVSAERPCLACRPACGARSPPRTPRLRARMRNVSSSESTTRIALVGACWRAVDAFPRRKRPAHTRSLLGRRRARRLVVQAGREPDRAPRRALRPPCFSSRIFHEEMRASRHRPSSAGAAWCGRRAARSWWPAAGARNASTYSPNDLK